MLLKLLCILSIEFVEHVRMATDNAIEKASKSACLEVSVELKAHQRSSIEAVLKRKDVFVTLPTGYKNQ